MESASVTAVSSRRPLDPTWLGDTYGTPLKPHTTYDERPADPDVHVVNICPPHSSHAEQAVAAAEAGKHLIIEIPVATNDVNVERVSGTYGAAQDLPTRHPRSRSERCAEGAVGCRVGRSRAAPYV